MEITPIKTPIGIQILRCLKRRLWVANMICLSAISLHIVLSLSFKDFAVLSAGGGLVCLLSLILFLSYSVPTSDKDFIKTLKIIYPLKHEFGQLADILPEEEKTKTENKRVVWGNKHLSMQAAYFWWSLVGTLLWAYAGFLNKIFFPASCY